VKLIYLVWRRSNPDPELYRTEGTVAADILAQKRADQREEFTLFTRVEVYPDLSSTTYRVAADRLAQRRERS
jgi:hypothetical protein